MRESQMPDVLLGRVESVLEDGRVKSTLVDEESSSKPTEAVGRDEVVNDRTERRMKLLENGLGEQCGRLRRLSYPYQSMDIELSRRAQPQRRADR